jgi:NADPH:quinone reductase-like Zn-dependent oxidoreductase
MKAVVQNGYGSPDVLCIKEMEKPQAGEDDVLIGVRAVSLNAGDLFTVRGSPWLVRTSVGFPKPKDYILGWDVAGRVEAVGGNVTRFQPGDAVYCTCSSAFAEYVVVPQEQVAFKPSNLTYEEAAAVPTAGLTALQGLRDAGKVQPGQRVLINGASGGVGAFAVQIAKSLGAEVTGVCSTRNVEMVRTLGADHVVDYTREDFTKMGQTYDLILDNVASRSLADLRRTLAPGGVVVPNSGHGGMSYVFKSMVASLFMRQHANMFMAKPNATDLAYLAELIESGKITPIIDAIYPLFDIRDALRHMDEQHAQGKLALTVIRDKLDAESTEEKKRALEG